MAMIRLPLEVQNRILEASDVVIIDDNARRPQYSHTEAVDPVQLVHFGSSWMKFTSCPSKEKKRMQLHSLGASRFSNKSRWGGSVSMQQSQSSSNLSVYSGGSSASSYRPESLDLGSSHMRRITSDSSVFSSASASASSASRNSHTAPSLPSRGISPRKPQRRSSNYDSIGEDTQMGNASWDNYLEPQEPLSPRSSLLKCLRPSMSLATASGSLSALLLQPESPEMKRRHPTNDNANEKDKHAAPRLPSRRGFDTASASSPPPPPQDGLRRPERRGSGSLPDDSSESISSAEFSSGSPSDTSLESDTDTNTIQTNKSLTVVSTAPSLRTCSSGSTASSSSMSLMNRFHPSMMPGGMLESHAGPPLPKRTFAKHKDSFILNSMAAVAPLHEAERLRVPERRGSSSTGMSNASWDDDNDTGDNKTQISLRSGTALLNHLNATMPALNRGMPGMASKNGINQTQPANGMNPMLNRMNRGMPNGMNSLLNGRINGASMMMNAGAPNQMSSMVNGANRRPLSGSLPNARAMNIGLNNLTQSIGRNSSDINLSPGRVPSLIPDMMRTSVLGVDKSPMRRTASDNGPAMPIRRQDSARGLAPNAGSPKISESPKLPQRRVSLEEKDLELAGKLRLDSYVLARSVIADRYKDSISEVAPDDHLIVDPTATANVHPLDALSSSSKAILPPPVVPSPELVDQGTPGNTGAAVMRKPQRRLSNEEMRTKDSLQDNQQSVETAPSTETAKKPKSTRRPRAKSLLTPMPTKLATVEERSAEFECGSTSRLDTRVLDDLKVTPEVGSPLSETKVIATRGVELAQKKIRAAPKSPNMSLRRERKMFDELPSPQREITAEKKSRDSNPSPTSACSTVEEDLVLHEVDQGCFTSAVLLDAEPEPAVVDEVVTIAMTTERQRSAVSSESSSPRSANAEDTAEGSMRIGTGMVAVREIGPRNHLSSGPALQALTEKDAPEAEITPELSPPRRRITRKTSVNRLVGVMFNGSSSVSAHEAGVSNETPPGRRVTRKTSLNRLVGVMVNGSASVSAHEAGVSSETSPPGRRVTRKTSLNRLVGVMINGSASVSANEDGVSNETPPPGRRVTRKTSLNNLVGAMMNGRRRVTSRTRSMELLPLHETSAEMTCPSGAPQETQDEPHVISNEDFDSRKRRTNLQKMASSLGIGKLRRKLSNLGNREGSKRNLFGSNSSPRKSTESSTHPPTPEASSKPAPVVTTPETPRVVASTVPGPPPSPHTPTSSESKKFNIFPGSGPRFARRHSLDTLASDNRMLEEKSKRRSSLDLNTSVSLTPGQKSKRRSSLDLNTSLTSVNLTPGSVSSISKSSVIVNQKSASPTDTTLRRPRNVSRPAVMLKITEKDSFRTLPDATQFTPDDVVKVRRPRRHSLDNFTSLSHHETVAQEPIQKRRNSMDHNITKQTESSDMIDMVNQAELLRRMKSIHMLSTTVKNRKPEERVEILNKIDGHEVIPKKKFRRRNTLSSMSAFDLDKSSARRRNSLNGMLMESYRNERDNLAPLSWPSSPPLSTVKFSLHEGKSTPVALTDIRVPL